MFLCFWSDSKYLFTIFLVPPLIHTQKTYTNLTLCIVIHILFHTSLITNDSCRTTKHYHIKQRYTAITASLTLITPLIGRINTSARSQTLAATAPIHQNTRRRIAASVPGLHRRISSPALLHQPRRRWWGIDNAICYISIITPDLQNWIKSLHFCRAHRSL